MSLRNNHVGESAGACGELESPYLILRESLPPGQAPPISVSTVENPEILLDDWLPALQRESSDLEWLDHARSPDTTCRLPQGKGPAGVEPLRKIWPSVLSADAWTQEVRD